MKKTDFLARPRGHGKSRAIADLVSAMTVPADLRAYSDQLQKSLSREYPPSGLLEHLAAEKAAKEAARKAYLETPEGKVEQVIEALNPPKPKAVPTDDVVDVLRYASGFKALKPENVAYVFSV